jgi:hypothetical protein
MKLWCQCVVRCHVPFLPPLLYTCRDGAPQLYRAFGIGGFAIFRHLMPKSRLLMCGYCHRTYCLHCSKRWHVPEPCSFQAGTRAEVEAMVVRLSGYGVEMAVLLPLLGVLSPPPPPPPPPPEDRGGGAGDDEGDVGRTLAPPRKGAGRQVLESVYEDDELWQIATAKAEASVAEGEDPAAAAYARMQAGLELLKRARCCPKCGAMSEKESGCNKVVCAVCGEWFCWLCGDSIAKGSAYASGGHFSRGGVQVASLLTMSATRLP